jgi:hypothetical protein
MMIETQLTPIAALLPSTEDGKILRQPVSSCENVCVVSTRWGEPSRQTRPNDYVGKPVQQVLDPWESSAIVHRRDPDYPAIICTIYYQKIKNALCDLGASVNLMSKAMFERLGYPALSPTSKTVQLADASIRHPKGIVESLLVFVQGSCIFMDFVVLDMQDDEEMPLNLGRPFLSDAKARINVGNGTIRFRIGKKNLMFRFRPTEEQCYSMQGNYEQIGEWMDPRPQLKQPLTASKKPKKTNKV